MMIKCTILAALLFIAAPLAAGLPSSNQMGTYNGMGEITYYFTSQAAPVKIKGSFILQVLPNWGQTVIYVPQPGVNLPSTVPYYMGEGNYGSANVGVPVYMYEQSIVGSMQMSYKSKGDKGSFGLNAVMIHKGLQYRAIINVKNLRKLPVFNQ